MTKLLLHIKAISPLYIGALKPYGAFLETHRQIPGGLLRGAVATKTLPECAAPEFIHIHEACAVKDICPFYYSTVDVRYPICAVSEGGHPTEPPLRTMVTCKVALGFKHEVRTRELGHGVFDMLIHHLVFSELRQLGSHPNKLPPQKCPHCEAALEPFRSCYIVEGEGRYHAVSYPKTRRMTHVGINRRRETAEQGLLYSVQSIAEGAEFAGYVTLPDSWDETRVERFKESLISVKRIGGEQTYGLGCVEIKVKEVKSNIFDTSTRIRAFNEKLKSVWDEYAQGEALPKGTYFTIDLLTPALLATPDGTPTVQLTAEMLVWRALELGFPELPRVEPVHYIDASGSTRPLMFAGPTIVSGWSEARRLPKATSLAAVTGGVYVFRTGDIDAWSKALEKIEACGIGDRREEGFGAVRVCDPFHQEVKPV